MRGVLLLKFSPFFRQIISRIDSRDGADRNARAAVNALDRIDEELIGLAMIALILLGVDAVHRASIDARGILRSDARLCDYICHKTPLLVTRFRELKFYQ
jgi:hypothetical protein